VSIPSHPWDLSEDLERFKTEGRLRFLRSHADAQGAWIRMEEKRVLNLCSNDYLGLSAHPRLREAAAEAAEAFGTGAGASRLVCGTMDLHEKLEARISSFLGSEAALLFNSGYQANGTVIPALVGRGDAVFSDALNHASLIDGCRLSRARISVYPHLGLSVLEEQLRTSSERRKLVVTESLFSMEGDLAPLRELAGLCERFGAWLYVDEAHATGVLGGEGRGGIEAAGIRGRVPVVMGTLGKALGSFGAYLAGSSVLKNYLVNGCRGFIFSTALPPSVVAASLEAFSVLEEEPERRRRLWDNVRFLQGRLEGIGVSPATSPIFSIRIGGNERTMEVSRRLFEQGVFVQGIRPPTVPEGTSRLRVTVTASHGPGELSRFADLLAEILADGRA
jgi:8-amino-7-oxononanoate synthase